VPEVDLVDDAITMDSPRETLPSRWSLDGMIVHTRIYYLQRHVNMSVRESPTPTITIGVVISSTISPLTALGKHQCRCMKRPCLSGSHGWLTYFFQMRYEEGIGRGAVILLADRILHRYPIQSPQPPEGMGQGVHHSMLPVRILLFELFMVTWAVPRHHERINSI